MAPDSLMLPPEELGTLRNVGISAHIDSGKTTLTERILYYTGRIDEMHEVRGNDGVGAVTDSMPLERERGITIKSAATYVDWNGMYINIIDTPGHVDFTIEVERSLKVLDGAILLLCGVSGVQSQTLTVHRQMNRYEVPRLVFINKLDRLGADPFRVLKDLKESLGLRAATLQLPIGAEETFEGVVDVLDHRAVYFRGRDGQTVEYGPVPSHLTEQTAAARQTLIETLADVDSSLADAYLEEREITTPMIRAAIRRATLTRQFVPVLMGSAYKNKGVQPLLDAVVAYLPDPRQRINRAYDLSKFDAHSEDDPPPEAVVNLYADPTASFVGLVFKIMETRFGQLSWLRVYQGTLKKGAQVRNLTQHSKIRIPRLGRMHADSLQDIEVVKAGDICAVFGLECSSGDALSDRDSQLAMSKMFVPEPVVSVGVQVQDRNKTDAMLKVLGRFAREDPTFRYQIDAESGQIQISGMGELHLEIYCEQLRRDSGIQVTTGKPYVSYRETIVQRARFDHTFKRQSGGAGQYAKIMGYMEPIEPGSKETFQFENRTTGNNLTASYVLAVKKGFEEACLRGPLIGNPAWGIRFVLEDGAMHQVDSSELAFKICAGRAFLEAFPKAGGTLLQPIMKLEVSIPSAALSAILTGIQKRGGRARHTDVSGTTATIIGEVPLAKMFGYTAELRSNTAGRGESSMEYLKHELMEEFELPAVLREYGKAPVDPKAAKKK